MEHIYSASSFENENIGLKPWQRWKAAEPKRPDDVFAESTLQHDFPDVSQRTAIHVMESALARRPADDDANASSPCYIVQYDGLVLGGNVFDDFKTHDPVVYR